MGYFWNLFQYKVMFTYEDQMGYSVSLPATPKHIVSLVPSITEMLYFFGCGLQIVGQTVFCIHPSSEFKKAVKVGGTKRLNIHKIRSLNPDLIIGSKEENTRESIETLQKEFPVWMSDIQDLDDAIRMIQTLGSMLGKEQVANTLATDIHLLFQNPLQAKKSCLYLIWREPFMAVGANTFIQDLLSRFGWQNVCKDYSRYPVLSVQEIQLLAPSYIFLSSEPYPFKQKHVEELKIAVPNAQIVFVDGELFSWYGCRLVLAAPYFRHLVEITQKGSSE